MPTRLRLHVQWRAGGRYKNKIPFDEYKFIEGGFFMINKEIIIKNVRKIIDTLHDTRYATSDLEERLALARMDVAHTRAGLLDANDSKTAELYAAKLKAAQEEYRRVLKKTRERKAI